MAFSNFILTVRMCSRFLHHHAKMHGINNLKDGKVDFAQFETFQSDAIGSGLMVRQNVVSVGICGREYSLHGGH